MTINPVNNTMKKLKELTERVASDPRNEDLIKEYVLFVADNVGNSHDDLCRFSVAALVEAVREKQGASRVIGVLHRLAAADARLHDAARECLDRILPEK